MLNPLKFRTKDRPIFFTADPHFCHKIATEKRGYPTPESHNEDVIRIWNETIDPSAMVIVVGDYILDGSVELFKTITRRLNGDIFYINGNHNGFIRSVYKEEVVKQYGINNVEIYPVTWENKLTFWGWYREIIINGQYICLNHYEQVCWNEMKRGSWLVCGNEHGEVLDLLPDDKIGKKIDVGWEVFNRPVLFEELKIIMDSKQIKTRGHH